MDSERNTSATVSLLVMFSIIVSFIYDCLRRVSLLILTCVMILFGGSCSENSSDSDADNELASPPAWLLQGWIWPIANNAVRTYDFSKDQVGGVYPVEIRSWQAIGTLGWQSNQQFSGVFSANNENISLSTATGYREDWRIVGRTESAVTIEGISTGQQVTWYNCSEPGWPNLVLASMRGCQNFN